MREGSGNDLLRMRKDGVGQGVSTFKIGFIAHGPV